MSDDTVNAGKIVQNLEIINEWINKIRSAAQAVKNAAQSPSATGANIPANCKARFQEINEKIGALLENINNKPIALNGTEIKASTPMAQITGGYYYPTSSTRRNKKSNRNRRKRRNKSRR